MNHFNWRVWPLRSLDTYHDARCGRCRGLIVFGWGVAVDAGTFHHGCLPEPAAPRTAP